MHILPHFLWLWLKCQSSFQSLSSIILVCLTDVLAWGQPKTRIVVHHSSQNFCCVDSGPLYTLTAHRSVQDLICRFRKSLPLARSSQYSSFHPPLGKAWCSASWLHCGGGIQGLSTVCDCSTHEGEGGLPSCYCRVCSRGEKLFRPDPARIEDRALSTVPTAGEWVLPCYSGWGCWAGLCL